MNFIKTITKRSALWSNEAGSILVEAALTFLLLVPILIGVSDLGLATKEWLEVNNLVEAATLFVTKHANLVSPTESYNIYATASFDATTITAALGVAHSGINPNVGSLTVTSACNCPSAGANICSGKPFSKPQKCPGSCAVSEGTINQSAYICIAVTHQHQSLFGAIGYSPTLAAKSVVKIF